jgi:hypothetical protein
MEFAIFSPLRSINACNFSIFSGATFLGCDLSLDITIDAINDRQHPDNKIDFTHHNLAMVTQLDGEQYQESNQSLSIETFNIRNICRTRPGQGLIQA